MKSNSYSKKLIDSSYYQEIKITGDKPVNLTDEEFKAGKPGYVYMPYKLICTHTEITDANGTRRYRNVSRWFLFKLRTRQIYSKMTNLLNEFFSQVQH
jgi:hypothetical protein